MPRLTSLAALAVLAGAGGAARADDNPQPTDSLVMPRHAVVLDAALEMNLSSGAAFQPVSLAPDLWFGVTDALALGIVHSAEGRTGFVGPTGDALCLTGSSNGCPHVYPGGGLDARIRLVTPLALDVGLYALDTDPFQLAIKLGIGGRWIWNRLSLQVQPSLFVGLTNRTPAGLPPNTEEFDLPITLAFLVLPRLDLALQPGLVLPFTNTGDAWRIPLALAARFAATPRFGVGLAFAFLDLIGGDAKTGASERSLTLGGSYAF